MPRATLDPRYPSQPQSITAKSKLYLMNGDRGTCLRTRLYQAGQFYEDKSTRRNPAEKEGFPRRLSVCLSVCFFSHDISKTDAVRITELNIETFNKKFWKCIYFGVKRSKVKVTKTVQVRVVTHLRVLASSSLYGRMASPPNLNCLTNGDSETRLRTRLLPESGAAGRRTCDLWFESLTP